MYDPPGYLWAITIAGIIAIPAATVTGFPPAATFSVSPGVMPIGSPPSIEIAVVAEGVTLNVSLPAWPLTTRLLILR